MQIIAILCRFVSPAPNPNHHMLMNSFIEVKTARPVIKQINKSDSTLLKHTADSCVGLNKHLASLLPQQHRLAQVQKVVSASVAYGGVVVIESPASFHVCR